MSLILRSIREPFIPEYKFAAPKRQWRLDFAYPSLQIGIECEGGTWIKGRHTTGQGYARDCEKYNYALLSGWYILRYTTEMISKQQLTIKKQIEILIKKRREGFKRQLYLTEQTS